MNLLSGAVTGRDKRMDKLIIRLLAHSSLTDWCWVDDTGHIKQSGYQSKISTIPSNPEAEIVVLIPTLQTLITEITLPPKIGQKHWRAAAASILEEQISEELEEVHIAIGAPSSANQYPVIVVKRVFITQWIEELNSAQLKPTVMIPDCYALPWEPDHATIWWEHDITLVRLSKNRGFAIEGTQLHWVLSGSLDNTSVTALDIWHRDQAPPLENIVLPTHAHTTPNEYLPLFATALEQPPAINLLQAEFSVSKQSTINTKELIRWGIQVFSVWLVMFIGGYSLEWSIFSKRNATLENTITALYHEVFPDAKSVVSPKQRIEHELSSLNQQGNQTDFIPMMYTVEIVHKNLPEITVQAAEYHHLTLQIQVSAQDFKHIDQLDAALVKQGLQVKRENASTSAEGVSARLTLSGGSV